MESITIHELECSDTDEVLIRRILQGDDVAFGVLYDRHAGSAYSVAKRILQEEGAAEQVLQDVFRELWRSAGNFDSSCASLDSWLLVLTWNRSIDRLRRRAPAVEDEVVTRCQELGLKIETRAARNAMAERVREAWRALPEAQREAMELACFEGLSQSEIARRTGEPLGTAKTRLRTALASLKAELGE
ncbi:MAG: sigma-70 family RNA polymerase sigma factor [Terriglobia bacterium]